MDRGCRCQDCLQENGYIESFNARLRDELLNGEIFYTLRKAQIVIESWRRHYNTIRPHACTSKRRWLSRPRMFLEHWGGSLAVTRVAVVIAGNLLVWRIQLFYMPAIGVSSFSSAPGEAEIRCMRC